MSTLDPRNLPNERLATTDEEGGRLWIIPARVRGKWKNRKTIFHIVLLSILVLVPWLRWNGAPIVLLDISNRQFIFFGEVFASHDGPIVFFVLAILTLGLALITSLYGRIWCGWACPQTVFIEQVFRRIESFVIGNRATQVQANKHPFRPKYFFRHLTKWVLFIAVSVVLAHTLMAYFVSWEKLLEMMARPPAESWTIFLTVFILSAVFLFDFAWFREQFCIIMCPYGRIQSVLMDSHSITVAYDDKRGEPRSRNIKDNTQGDCIDCYKCVSVCPTGIDIRQGQQMECIGCTGCIDACDEVMEKIKRPKGLIRYASLREISGRPNVRWRARPIVYSAIILGLFLGLVYSVASHEEIYYSVLRQNQRPYSTIQESGQDYIINNFRIQLRNSKREPLAIKVELGEASDVTMAPGVLKMELKSRENRTLPFFLKFKKADWEKLKGLEIPIQVTYGKDNQALTTVKLVSP